MLENHKTSSRIILALIFFLPIFFIPGGFLSLDAAKSALLVIAVVISILVFLLETWKEGKLDVPWHLFVIAAPILTLVYLLSAFLATPSSLSLLGYNFEVGTFGFMLLGTLFLVLGAMVFSETRRVLQALTAFFASLSLIAIFVALKVLFGLGIDGDILVWGNFLSNMGNPIGNWTDLGVLSGLLAVSASLSLGIVSMKKAIQILVYAIFVLAVWLLVITNFSTAFILTLGASILLSLYFWKIEKNFPETNFFLKPTLLPVILGIISIIFLINPTISETKGRLGDVVSTAFKVQNTDVRPSFSATLSVSKGALSQGELLGSGPNTFGRDWLIFRPIDVNATPFWGVSFLFGSGFIPTQIASTGIIGSFLWLAFFILFMVVGIKALSQLPESRNERFVLLSLFLIPLFIWVSSFLYTPSVTMLMSAFIFSGLLVSLGRKSSIVPTRTFNLKEFPSTRFVSLFLLIVVAAGTLYLGSIASGKILSAYHFKKAVELSNSESISLIEIESELGKALESSQADIYYIALSRVNFAKAQAAANATTGTPEENKAAFEDSLRKSIEAARSAVSANPSGYQNWLALGLIYSSLVPAPLSVSGAYESASFAYSEANKRNPNNPELPLLKARLELSNGNQEEARSLLRNSIALKEDYADAYLMLAQLEIQSGNIAEAINSAERLAALMPDNAGLLFELGVLKYSNKDYAGAEKIFVALVSAIPDYANAKYYLGMSLSNLGRKNEARKQFEDLLVTNPDNEDLKATLRNLK